MEIELEEPSSVQGGSWLSNIFKDQLSQLRRSYDLTADAAQVKNSLGRLISTWLLIALIPHLVSQVILTFVGEGDVEFTDWLSAVLILSPLSRYLGRKFNSKLLITLSPHLLIIGFIGVSIADLINFQGGGGMLMYMTFTFLIIGSVLPAWHIFPYLFLTYIGSLFAMYKIDSTANDAVFLFMALGVAAVLIFLITFFTESLLDAKEKQGTSLKLLYENNDRVLKEVAHKLKTPVTTLRLDLEHEKEKEKGEIEISRIKGFLDDITNGIDTLIKLSKIDMSTAQMPNQSVNLESFLLSIVKDAEMLTRNYEKLNEQRRTVNLLLPSKLKSNIINIPVVKIREAILNIIDNSIIHSPDRAIVNIDIKVIRSGNYYKISIIDDGVGISQESLRDLLSSGRSKETERIHIGLGIARNIIENNEGKFEISSKPGEGTTVEIFLPA